MSITPLEQFENPILFLPLPIISIGLTKLTLYSIFVLIILYGFFVLPFINKVSFVGTRWTLTLEAFYTSVSSILKEQVGNYSEYIPVTISLFSFVLFANLLSNIPYSFGVTTSVVVCLGISVIIFIGVTAIGITTHKVHAASFFVPENTPLLLVPVLVIIETISYIARAFSLGVRLFSNLTAGHILLAVLSAMIWTVMTSNITYAFVGLIPFSIFTGLYALELAVSLIQAYVLTLLFCSYLNDAINLH